MTEVAPAATRTPTELCEVSGFACVRQLGESVAAQQMMLPRVSESTAASGVAQADLADPGVQSRIYPKPQLAQLSSPLVARLPVPHSRFDE